MSIALKYAGYVPQDVLELKTLIAAATVIENPEDVDQEIDGAVKITVFMPDNTGALDVAAVTATMETRGFDRIS